MNPLITLGAIAAAVAGVAYWKSTQAPPRRKKKKDEEPEWGIATIAWAPEAEEDPDEGEGARALTDAEFQALSNALASAAADVASADATNFTNSTIDQWSVLRINDEYVDPVTGKTVPQSFSRTKLLPQRVGQISDAVGALVRSSTLERLRLYREVNDRLLRDQLMQVLQTNYVTGMWSTASPSLRALNDAWADVDGPKGGLRARIGSTLTQELRRLLYP